MRSKWVKLLPWYYTKRRQPTRAAERESAIAADLTATCGPGLEYERMVEAIERLPEYEPLEPLKLAREQMAWLRLQIPSQPYDSYRFSTLPLLGTPIRIVETYAESTPHLKGWAGWHVVGHPDATFPPSSASVAPQSEETE
jgi:hypothetical protein